MDKLSATTRLSRSAHLFSSEIDQDLVMLDEKKGLYFCLNEVGKTVWQKLEKPCTYGELLASLTHDYQMDNAEQCQADVEFFLQKMMNHQLIQVVA